MGKFVEVLGGNLPRYNGLIVGMMIATSRENEG
jgi:hypothetical protein